MNRYYLSAKDWEGSQLLSDEAHHCAQVMRQKVGDTIEIFDGVGHAATASITSLSKQVITFEWLCAPQLQQRAQPSIRLHLCLPKAKAFDWLLFKIVELGVSELQPLISKHSTLPFKSADFAKKEAKWQRMLLEACKQCGQNWLPQLRPITTYQDWNLAFNTDENASSFKIMGALLPESKPLSEVISSILHHQSSVDHVDILIGPEGDLSATEYSQALAQGWQPCSLGPLVLRVETATIYAISGVQLHLNSDY